MSIFSSVAKATVKGRATREKIKAFHGSPHDFDRFSSDNIGTGEGAQAYGHGLYFAEREGTAQSYRDALSGKNPSPRYKGKDIDETDGPTSGALSLIKKELLYNRGLTAKQAKEQAIISLNGRKRAAAVGVDSLKEDQIISGIDEKIRLIESMDDSDLVVGGRMYEVDIDASPDELLDYDVDLIDQSQKVKDGILKLGLKDLNGKKYSIQKLDDLGYRGQTLYEKISVNAGADVASMRLKDVGIKGIKYADAQTRFSPKGRTNNYVMFDDKTIEIARKYGVSMPVAGAILAGTMTPEQAQAGVGSVGKAASDLAMDYSSRMARAKDQGFDFADGGSRDAAFDPARRFDKNYLASGVTAVGSGALFSPDEAHAKLMTERDELAQLAAMGSNQYGKASPELMKYRRSQILPTIGEMGMGILESTVDGLDFMSQFVGSVPRPKGSTPLRNKTQGVLDTNFIDKRDLKAIKEARAAGSLFSFL